MAEYSSDKSKRNDYCVLLYCLDENIQSDISEKITRAPGKTAYRLQCISNWNDADLILQSTPCHCIIVSQPGELPPAEVYSRLKKLSHDTTWIVLHTGNETENVLNPEIRVLNPAQFSESELVNSIASFISLTREQCKSHRALAMLNATRYLHHLASEVQSGTELLTRLSELFARNAHFPVSWFITEPLKDEHPVVISNSLNPATRNFLSENRGSLLFEAIPPQFFHNPSRLSPDQEQLLGNIPGLPAYTSVVSRKLSFKNEAYGYFYFAAPANSLFIQDELELFAFAIEDISHALYTLARTQEKCRIESEFQEEQRKLRTLINNIPGAAFRCKYDNEWTMEYISNSIVTITGYEPAEIIHNTSISYNDIIHPADRQMVSELIEQNIKSQQHYSIEYRVLSKTGATRWVWEQGSPIILPDSTVSHLEGYILDITDRILDREKLSERERQYHDLAEMSQALICEIDMQGRFIYVNSAFESVLGYQSEDLLGKPVTSFCDSATGTQFKNYMRASLHPLPAETNEWLFYDKSGAPHWLSCMPNPYTNIDGRQRLNVVSFDISEKRITEQALRANEELFRRTFYLSPVATYMVSMQDIIIQCNIAASTFLGRSNEEIINHNYKDFIFPGDLAIGMEQKNELLTGTLESAQFEKRFVQGDGSIVWGEVSLSIVRDSEDKPLYYLPIIQDITERKLTEERYLNERYRLKTLIETIPDLVWLKNPEGHYISCNPRFETFFGKLENTVIGKTDYDFFTKTEADFFTQSDNETIEKNQPTTYMQWVNCAANHSRVLLQTIKTPMFDSEGKLLGVLGIARDMTNEHYSREALKEREEIYSSIVNQANLAIGLLDPESGVFVEFNETACEMLGYMREEFAGLTLYEIDANFTSDRMNARLKEIIDKDGYQFETRHRHKDGRMLTIHVSARPVIIREKLYLTLIWQDITEKKRQEETIREKDLVFQAMLDFSPIQIFIKDHNLRASYLSRNFEEMIGRPLNEIVGKDMYELFPYDLARKIIEDDRNVLFGGKRLVTDEELGGRFYTTIKFPIDRDNKPPLLAGFSIDITDRKKAELALQRSEAQLAAFMNFLPAGVLIKDHELRPVYANTFLRNFFAIDEWIGKTPHETFPEDVADDMVARDSLAMREGYTEYEEVWKDTHGFPHTYLTQKFRIDLPGGRPLLGAIISDITERKQSQLTIEHEKKFSEMLIESLPGIFYMFDSDMKFIRWNKNTQDFLQLTSDEMYMQNFASSIAVEDRLKLISLIDNIWKSSEASDELRLIRHDNQEFVYKLTGKLLNTPRGKMLLGVGIDISVNKRLEAELIKEKEKAEESSRVKSSFLANMSHELRTPLIGILGYSEILQHEKFPDDVQNMAGIIHKSGYRLMETLNMILDLSRIEADKLVTQLANINIADIARDVVVLYKEAAAKKNLLLSLKVKQDSLLIYSDKRMVTDILINLVNNAIKYTEQGSITVSVTGSILKNKPYATIHVEDTGIGISALDQEVIWEEFRQASEGRGRSFEGSGLGLTLTKKFVDKLNGVISLRSQPGKGSVFSVSFPMLISMPEPEFDFAETIKQELEILPVNNASQLKILAVDDDEVTLEYMSFALQEHFTIHTCKKASQVISMLKATRYSALLLDINLGRGITGLDVLGELRKLPDYATTPVIAVTAYAMEGDREEFISQGCTDYISKPFNKQDLLRILHKNLQI